MILLNELGFIYGGPMALNLNITLAQEITTILVFYDRTKHVGVGCHFKRRLKKKKKLNWSMSIQMNSWEIFPPRLLQEKNHRGHFPSWHSRYYALA